MVAELEASLAWLWRCCGDALRAQRQGTADRTVGPKALVLVTDAGIDIEQETMDVCAALREVHLPCIDKYAQDACLGRRGT